jgi:hypothetical protein
LMNICSNIHSYHKSNRIEDMKMQKFCGVGPGG